jgi:hypothetical protein
VLLAFIMKMTTPAFAAAADADAAAAAVVDENHDIP